MKRGTKVHKKLERELFTTVEVATTKKEDKFGLKIWNMIQGLRVLRERGFTREFEVWGMVEGNLVCGVIDRMSSENPDAELQEDVLSNRGSSQTITNSQPYELSTPGDYEIFISDVKTRSSASPPPQPQVRVSLIQLFLYHRFISDMASDRLDYMRVFERYDLNPDEPFSDVFIEQIGVVHDEAFTEADAETASTLSDHEAADVDSNADFVSAPSSPSQVSFADLPEPKLKYRSLRTLVGLLKLELALTFPRGASDLGKIVAVEYRYRGRDSPPPSPTVPPTTITTDPDPTTTNPNGLGPADNDDEETDPLLAPDPETEPELEPAAEAKAKTAEPKHGSVICTHTFFVEPETLDMYLSETMRWWRGERPPRGVAPDEAGFKCRTCDFRDTCAWRAGMDREALRRAQSRKSARSTASVRSVEVGAEVDAEAAAAAAAAAVGGDIEDAGGRGPSKGASGGKRRGRPRKADKEKGKDIERQMDADADAEVEVEVEDRTRVKRGRGRPRKSTAAGGVYA
jgi:exonuclease V